MQKFIFDKSSSKSQIFTSIKGSIKGSINRVGYFPK
nr:MAG TPA: hypothetical protein [Caudoviricetes sp.]